MAGTTHQIQAVIDSGSVKELVESGTNHRSWEVAREANVASMVGVLRANQDQVRYLVSVGGIHSVCNMLNVVKLTAVAHALEVGDVNGDI